MTEANVTQKFDYRNSTLYAVGLLNCIIRYGGDGLKNHVRDLAGSTQSFAPIRKYVLDTADSTLAADNTLKKIVSYTGDQAGDLSLAKNKVLLPIDTKNFNNIKQSLMCSPAYKVVPQVGIKRKGHKDYITVNTDLKIIDGVAMQIKGVNLTTVSNSKVTDGLVPIWDGSFEADFFTPTTKNRKYNILEQIAKNLDTIGYVFQMGKEYELHLRNLPKTQKFNKPSDRKAYEALCNNDIVVNVCTLRYEMTSFKPYENRATFTFYVRMASMRGSSSKDAASTGVFSRDAGDGIPIKDPAFARRAAAEKAKSTSFSLMNAILAQLTKNKSHFDYHYTLEDDPLFGEPTINYRVMTTPTIDSPVEIADLDKPTLAKGSFFLMRSLLVAVINTFYKDTTTLDDLYQEILFEKADYEKLKVLINQTKVPSEIGSYFTEGPDVRTTFETMVVDHSVYQKFMIDLGNSGKKITLRLLLEKIFSELTVSILNSSISASDVDNDVFNSFGKDYVTYDMSPKKNLSEVGEGYKVQERELASISLNPKTSRYLYLFGGGAGTRTTHKLDSTNLNLYGKLKIKNVSSVAVINGIMASAKSKENFKAIIIDKKGIESQTVIDIRESANAKHKKARSLLAAKNRDIIKNGIIPVDWYKKATPEENLKFRVISNSGETPFKFAVFDNQGAESDRRLASGRKPILYNIYSVSFTLADVLGVVPNLIKFYFKPELFGFGSVEEEVFGFSGVYQVTSTTISYNQENSRFETSVQAKYEKKDPNNLYDATGKKADQRAEVMSPSDRQKQIKEDYNHSLTITKIAEQNIKDFGKEIAELNKRRTTTAMGTIAERRGERIARQVNGQNEKDAADLAALRKKYNDAQIRLKNETGKRQDLEKEFKDLK